jgi:hypothetical protein
MVRPDSLVSYWPFFQGSGAADEGDWVGGFTLTENSVITATAHPPRIIYPHVQEPPISAFWPMEPDWVGENPMRIFGTVNKAEHP